MLKLTYIFTFGVLSMDMSFESLDFFGQQLILLLEDNRLKGKRAVLLLGFVHRQAWQRDHELSPLGT